LTLSTLTLGSSKITTYKRASAVFLFSPFTLQIGCIPRSAKLILNDCDGINALLTHIAFDMPAEYPLSSSSIRVSVAFIRFFS
jgi:hypothetical protein